MKIKINKERRLLALYLRRLEAWEVLRLTTRGQLYAHQAKLVGFSPVFSEAITAIRKEDRSIPASGWEGTTVDTRPFANSTELAAHVWETILKPSTTTS